MKTTPTSGQTETQHEKKVRLCQLDDLVSGQAQRFVTNGHDIAVVRIDDQVYAVGDRCTHQDVSLSEGEVYTEDAEIECIRHGSTFSLVTGEALSLPATRPTPVYPIDVVNGEVHVEFRR